MTTMLRYNRHPIAIDDLIDFNPDEPEPLPDAMQQELPIQEILHTLSARFTGFGRLPDVFLSSNTFICYDPNNLNVRVSPDCYLAFGVDAGAIRRRRLYLPWEAGKPPDFALEVGSDSTGRQDVVEKRGVYARIGIPEYWRFDPTGGEFHGAPLAGDRLVEGEYLPMELTEEPDGLLKGHSPTLGLSLCWNEGRLFFYDPETGTYIRHPLEEQVALEAAQAVQEATQASLESTQAALQAEREAREAEREAREADRARIRELEERLRRMQSEE